jgi:hypothetical protein
MVYRFGQLHKNENQHIIKEDTLLIPYIYTDKNRQSLRIVTKAGMLWDTGNDAAIHMGNITHKILSDVHTFKDIPNAINKAVLKGLLSEKDAPNMQKRVLEVVQHPQLKTLFEDGNVVWNEREIITANGPNLRPDRVVLKNDQIYIIDYKTGQKNEAYANQVETYAQAYILMGHSIAQKIIVYITDQIIVELI